MKTKASIFALVFSLLLGACAPSGTPVAGPDISGKVILIPPDLPATFTITSASVSPGSLGYSYDCGTTSVPPATLTFTVLIHDPDKMVKDAAVWIDVSGSTADPKETIAWSSLLVDQLLYLKLTGTSADAETWSGTSMDLGANISAKAAGSTSFKVYWFASASNGYNGVETPIYSISLAPCKAPLVVTIVPPHIDATILPPGSADKPKPGGGGAPPSCSVEPNNPNCVP
jgi:hypothetical protein